MARVAGCGARPGPGRSRLESPDDRGDANNPADPAARERVAELLERRISAGSAFFGAESERLARCCHAMAERFASGGRLVAFGQTPAARSDARHVAVEFVHPVIVGKRALPALAIVPEGGALDVQARLLVEADDVAIGFGVGDGGDEETVRAMAVAGERGCLTIAFGTCGADWEFEPPRDDPFVRQELIETLYHVLWELVHIFFEHRGLLSGREAGKVHDTGASSFLYPFLSESEHDIDAILADVGRSVVLKEREIEGLRTLTLERSGELAAAAVAIRTRLDAGGRVLAFGNGGSATDAMDLVADLRAAPAGAGEGAAAGWPGRPAIELTEDASIITAVANDVGVEEIFQRQVIAYGRESDVAIAFSTSGGSENILEALAEARRRGLLNVAFSGYDGGKIASQGLADHLILSPSEYIPRIQEAQASAYHVLRELIERD